MAFNPLNWFRKHQKVIFAIITIVIMFVFILSFGRGDAFERIMSIAGASRASGALVTTLNGTKVREGDLDKTGKARALASHFLFATAFETHPRVLGDLLNG